MITWTIRETLAQDNMTIADLARLTDLDYQTIWRLTTGRSKAIYTHTLDKICTATGRPPSDFITWRPTHD